MDQSTTLPTRPMLRELGRVLDDLQPCPESDCVLRYTGVRRERLAEHLRVVHGWSRKEVAGLAG